MTVFSRRSFLGGTAAATGLLAGVSGVPVAASSTQAPGPQYGPAGHIAKLNANENPYGPSPIAIREAFEAVLAGEPTREQAAEAATAWAQRSS